MLVVAMSITNRELKGKQSGAISRISIETLTLVLFVLVAVGALGLGILIGKEMARSEPKDPFWVEQLPKKEVQVPAGGGPASVAAAISSQRALESRPAEILTPSAKVLVASKSGSKYYFPECAGAKRIKAENQVWFASKEEAESAGYSKAANCAGL